MTTAAWQQVRVRCYGQTRTKELATLARRASDRDQRLYCWVSL
jgi:hypothetical protein